MPGPVFDRVDQRDHLDGRQCRFTSLVVRPVSRTDGGLLLCQRRQHAKRDRNARVRAHRHDSLRHRGRDVLEVHRLALDDAAQTDDGVISSSPCETTGGQRDLEGTRHADDGDAGAIDAGITQSRARAAKQPVSDVLVESRHDDGKAATGGLGRALQLFHVSEKTPGVISEGCERKLHPVS